jgi:hypothetical protein
MANERLHLRFQINSQISVGIIIRHAEARMPMGGSCLTWNPRATSGHPIIPSAKSIVRDEGERISPFWCSNLECRERVVFQYRGRVGVPALAVMPQHRPDRRQSQIRLARCGSPVATPPRPGWQQPG